MAIQACGKSFQVGGKVIDAESDTDQNGNQSSESSSYYTAVSSSSSCSEASSRRSSVLVDSLENVNTGIGTPRNTKPVLILSVCAQNNFRNRNVFLKFFIIRAFARGRTMVLFGRATTWQLSIPTSQICVNGLVKMINFIWNLCGLDKNSGCLDTE